jgi:acyl transferase domain-containing protein
MLLARQTPAFVTQSLLDTGLNGSLSIACYNSAKDVVIGGPIEHLKVLKAHLEGAGTKCFDVAVPFAYHTAAMDPILDELTRFSSKFELRAPSIPVVANVSGRVVRPGDANVFDAGYFARHCRQPVQFEAGMVDFAVDADSVAAFIEIGPHPTTLPMVQSLSSSVKAETLHSLNKKSTFRAALLSALSRLFVVRDGIAWDVAYRQLYPTVSSIEIPGYPLVEKEFWVPFVEESAPAPIAAPKSSNDLEKYAFLGSWTQKPSSKDANISEFETPIESLADYIKGHNVVGSPLCPASVYYELALAAAKVTFEFVDSTFEDMLTLSDVHFSQPLVYDASKPLQIRTTINLHPNGSKHAGTFSISSALGGKEQSVHCNGFFQRRERDSMASKLQLHATNVERGKKALLDAGSYETLRIYY